METPELLYMCLTAFLAVGILLSILAALMKLILYIFPQKEEATDAVLLAAVATVAQQMYPGARVTRVEEIK